MSIGRKLVASVTDVRRIVRAAGYSISGLRAAVDKESSFRQELILFFLLAPLGAWLARNGIERSLLLGSLVLVLITELINSAIEAAVDYAGTERNEVAGRAKDIGSAAVLLAILLVIVVWVSILADRWV